MEKAIGVRGVPRRDEVAAENTWNAASVFADDAAWDAEMGRLAAKLPELTAYRGHLGEGPARLAAWMNLYFDTLTRMLHACVYASMFFEVDTADQQAAAKRDRVLGLWAQISAAVSFTEPELLAIGFDRLRVWVSQESGLAEYGHYVDALARLQAHVRSAEVEEVLGLVGDPFATASATHGVLADADMVFASARDGAGHERELTQGTIDALLADPDPEVRRTAFEHYADAHLALKNTMANCLAAGVKQNVFQARVRKYGDSLEAALTPNHIPVAVFQAVVDTFTRQLPIWHRYWDVRRRALGADILRVSDIKAPLTARSPHVTFEQGFTWIQEGLRPLGEEYVAIMRRGVLEQRWIDRYPNKGKRAGAFSSGAPGTHPFVLMSHTEDLESMSTLAHELGHSMHSYFTWRTQPPVYADYAIFVAEVASNFNQAMVRSHLLTTMPDRDFQIALLEEAMSNFHRYFFIMPTLARFELALHQRAEQGKPLTADVMIGLLDDLFREGYGSGVAIDRERIGSTWAQFPTHLYSNFYVFQYTTGISGANALARGVLDGKEGAVERYLGFLKAGSSGYPLDVLKAAGVDLSTPEPIEQTFAVLSGMIDRLESLLGLAR